MNADEQSIRRLVATWTSATKAAWRARRAGQTLTVFRQDGGRWLLARDANMRAPVAGA